MGIERKNSSLGPLGLFGRLGPTGPLGLLKTVEAMEGVRVSCGNEAVMALEDGCTNIEAERFGAFLTAPDCLASMNPDRFRQAGVAGTSGCTVAAHDDMKDLFSAVCVHVFA